MRPILRPATHGGEHAHCQKMAQQSLVRLSDATRMQIAARQGGEDLRGDQRVEQLFDVMNGLLAHHPPAQAADLRVRVTSPETLATQLKGYWGNDCILTRRLGERTL